jgi:hypothetical protein
VELNSGHEFELKDRNKKETKQTNKQAKNKKLRRKINGYVDG